MHGVGEDERVEGAKGRIQPVAVSQKIGAREHLHGRRKRIHIEVVGDEQAHINGVVGDELRGAGLEDVQLGLRPIEVSSEVAHPRISEFCLLSKQAFLVVQVDLTEKQRCRPNVILENKHIAQQ